MGFRRSDVRNRLAPTTRLTHRTRPLRVTWLRGRPTHGSLYPNPVPKSQPGPEQPVHPCRRRPAAPSRSARCAYTSAGRTRGSRIAEQLRHDRRDPAPAPRAEQRRVSVPAQRVEPTAGAGSAAARRSLVPPWVTLTRVQGPSRGASRRRSPHRPIAGPRGCAPRAGAVGDRGARPRRCLGGGAFAGSAPSSAARGPSFLGRGYAERR